jgi:hypothetical protein
MKLKTLLFLPIAMIGISNVSSFAQEKKEKTKIIIQSNNNGKITTKEMSFYKRMTQEEIDKLMAENSVDSSKIKVIKGNKKVTVTVDQEGNVNRNEEIETRGPKQYDEDNVEDFEPQIRTYRSRNPRITREEIGRRSRNIIDEIPYRIQRADDFLIETFNSDSPIASIKNIDAFANNPRSEFINVKFRSIKKDKITLTLVDLNGKVVAQDSVQDFSGDYFGQMKVDKNLKGNFFLIIAQGDDGESIRVNLK